MPFLPGRHGIGQKVDYDALSIKNDIAKIQEYDVNFPKELFEWG